MGLAGYGLGAIGAQGVGGLLADRLGRRNTIAVSMFGGSLLTLSLVWVSGLWAIIGVVILLGFVAELYRPASSALIVDLIPSERRVAAFSTYRLMLNLGFAVRPRPRRRVGDPVLRPVVHRRRHHRRLVRGDRAGGAAARHPDHEARRAASRGHRPDHGARHRIPALPRRGVPDRIGVHAERHHVRAPREGPGLFATDLRLPAGRQRRVGRAVRVARHRMDAASQPHAHGGAGRGVGGAGLRHARGGRGGAGTDPDGDHLDAGRDRGIAGHRGVRGRPSAGPCARSLPGRAGSHVRIRRGRRTVARHQHLPRQPHGAVVGLRPRRPHVGGAGACEPDISRSRSPPSPSFLSFATGVWSNHRHRHGGETCPRPSVH